MSNTVQVIVKVTDQATAPLRGITGALGSIGTVAGGIVAADLFGRITEGLLSAGRAGFDMNRSMENLSARLEAFNHDTAVTAEMLEWARLEAAKTPFAYEDIGNAIASVIPVANQLGVDYKELVQTGELLSALNPMEGIQGGVFSLKEALQGDFVSIAERFGLDKNRLRELRDEGVPILQAVQQVLGEMGVTMDLVAAQANTFDGRLDKMKETAVGLFSEFTKPIFSFLSEELAGAQMSLDEAMPRLQETARSWGQTAADSIQTFKEAWSGEWEDDEIIQPVHRFIGKTVLTLKSMWDKTVEVGTAFVGEIGKIWDATVEEIEDLKRAGDEWNEVLDASVELGGELKEVLDLLLGLFGDNTVEADKLNKKLGEAQSLGTTLEGIFRGLGDAMQWLADRVQDVYNALVALLLLAGQASTAVGTAAAGINAGATANANNVVDSSTPPVTDPKGQGSAPKPSVPLGDNRGQATGGVMTSTSTTVAPNGVVMHNVFHVYNNIDVEEAAYKIAAEIQQRRSNT